MNYNEVIEAAKTQVGPYCKACPVCNGRACANTVPGPGCKYPGNTAARNYDKWQEICVNMDTICENKPIDIGFELFGKKFVAPVLCAPVGAVNLHYGTKYDDLSYNRVLVKQAADYGVVAFTGDGADENVMKDAVKAGAESGGMSIATVKPWNKEAVFDKLDMIKKADLFAAAMDVDAAGLPFLKALNPNAGSKSVEELREIIDYAGRPFIIKGIMTVKGAEKAIEAGAAGIVVSNHGGRVQGGVPSTAEVLPAIVDAVGGKTKIFVDGGIRSGVDVFRALAIGADAVLIARPVLTAIYGSAEEGLKLYLNKITGELKATMEMCGCASLEDIDRSKIFGY